MSRKLKITLITIVVSVAGITAIIVAFSSSNGPGGVPTHLTVAQARVDTSGREIKVGGDVVPGSVIWENASHSLKFMLAGEGDQIPVVYRGVAPNGFKPGSPLLVEGTYSSSGVFLATSLATTTSPLCKACHG